MNTIKNNYESSYVIKKSKFISFIIKVDNKMQAKEIISEMKNKYKDASHVCYAYKIGTLEKASDDKEPVHTASYPILNVIKNNNLNNVIIIVARYFGGIKLGASNLSRAYKKAAEDVVLEDNIIEDKIYKKAKIEFLYDNIKQIDYILKDYEIIEKNFNQNVIYLFLYEENNYPKKLDNLIKEKTLH